MAEINMKKNGQDQPNNVTGTQICPTCGGVIDPNNSMQYFGMPGNQTTLNFGEIKNSDNASNTHRKKGLKKAPLQWKSSKSTCTPVRTFFQKQEHVMKLMPNSSIALANTENFEADKDKVDTDSNSAGYLANVKLQPKQKKKCLQRNKVAPHQRKPYILSSTNANIRAFLEKQKEVKKLMEQSSTTQRRTENSNRNSKCETDSSRHDTITAVKFQRKPKKKSLMYNKIAKVGKKRLSKLVKIRKKACMLNSTNANIRAFLKKQKEVKKLMQQSLTIVNTNKNSFSEKSYVDIDGRLHERIGIEKLKHRQNKKCLKRNKVGKKYRMKLSGLPARQKGKARKKIRRLKKEMHTDNESCNSSIPDKRKKEVKIKEQQRKAIVILPQKKKEMSDGYKYVIETNSPLPYGTFLFSVDNKKSGKHSVSQNACSENDSSESDSSDSFSNGYQPSTALCHKKRNRRSNYDDLIQKYKNKIPYKRRYKHRWDLD
ncbi:uncharacterized protein LOC119662452 [Teleopsis dalmanni]|uniref:uncharacterized protein LOC119662421 n=1 Tax=Teleopsis dalmanni TaxID=139649 RepID=UPI000D32BFA9|nr:uncharacterized protein LOC119662421 [Teleopsis dalmanni]XP_037927959.1 uncharacterized protein LOC119662421 [Teleopsis dalmanni]XP_037927960.1 uncharacterized protein LOC119662421 [Teleopsis dalmanni]XP_037928002.1 uncharacterized protein LOC119662452 [Teleopsis dalmanni]XP_037928003.1 uncharacterized protein LOC119662452 [Teleopsis dalmanni]